MKHFWDIASEEQALAFSQESEPNYMTLNAVSDAERPHAPTLEPEPDSISFFARGVPYDIRPIPPKDRDPIPPTQLRHFASGNTEVQEALSQHYCYQGCFSYPFRDGIERTVFYPPCTLGESCPFAKRMATPHFPFYYWPLAWRQVLADRQAFFGEQEAAIDEYYSRNARAHSSR